MSIHSRVKLDAVNQQIGTAQKRYAEVDNALKQNQKLLDELQSKDGAYASLNIILEHIKILESKDNINLLWGYNCNRDHADENRFRIESALKDYESRLKTAQRRRTILTDELARLDHDTRVLRALQQSLQDEISTKLTAPVIQKDITPITSIPIVLPWSNQRNDAIRLRVIMLAALFATLLITYIIPRWEIPEPERAEFVKIPERLATLILKKAPPPPPKPEQRPLEEAEQIDTPEQIPIVEEEISNARKVAEQTGLLAFKQDFAEIIGVSSGIKMGSQAVIIKKAGKQRRSSSGRSLITSQVELKGFVAVTPSVRRTEVITGDNNLKKVEFSHIENSEIAAVDSKQLSSANNATKRSDEEIQVVFDRYKEALYRIYNRELRINSFLKGTLVLQLTIEPDGKVSKCIINSSELKSAELENKIVARVLKFNFGEKNGASALTILYPIDFLPAS